MNGQMAFSESDDIQMEHLTGVSGRTIPILVTPTPDGAQITCPKSIDLLEVESLGDGLVRVTMRVPQAHGADEHDKSERREA